MLLALMGRGTAQAATYEVQVGIDLPGYFPDNLSIHPGDTVHWTWVGGAGEGMGHSVTSGNNGVANKLFDSGIQHKGFSFSHTFQSAGTFPYFCIPHYSFGMKGVVNVAAATPSTGVLSNISTRLQVGTNNDVLIGGFIIGGTGPKQLLLRGLGPTLTQFAVAGALANPSLELRNSAGGLLASNDNWGEAPNAQSVPSNLRPPNSLEPAILTSLNPGSYTAILRGANNNTGVGLVEAYDIAPNAGSHLINISTRGLVQTGNNVMIAGMIVQSNNLAVLVRALGPTLSGFGVTNSLANPSLELHDANGNLITANDNWKGTQQAEILATGKAPPNDLESAIVRTLSPGNYTAVVKGVNGTTGVALVEVYTLP